MNVKKCVLYTLLMAMDRKWQKSLKYGKVNHTNIDIQAILVWITLPFYDFFLTFAVFEPSPLTVCITAVFFTFIPFLTDCNLGTKADIHDY